MVLLLCPEQVLDACFIIQQTACQQTMPFSQRQCLSAPVVVLTWCALDVQRLGFYDPLKKETNLNAPAIKKWLEVGAQPSETVRDLLKRAMVIE